MERTFANSASSARQLSDSPNISFVLAEQLRLAGIPIPQDLRARGSWAGWQAPHQHGFHPSIQKLPALAEAIQGTHAPDIIPTERWALIRFGAEHTA